MPVHEFGIIESISTKKDYSDYCPKKYDCISVDDEIIELIISKLSIMKTFYHNINRPEFGLAYYGVTLIPPESLKYLEDVLLKQKVNSNNPELNQLIGLVRIAIENNKYLIHFGI